MDTEQSKYEVVIGLEVHAQLLTESKLFSGDSTVFGAAPNSQVSPITLGHPGTLPMMNEKAISHAVKMGLVCHSEISRNNYFARKNYFYPDLPKGYQISQHTTPICKGGFVSIKIKGETRDIKLTRIHLEEDAGKSIHDIDPAFTCVDYNRAGVALVEIVSEPDMHSGEEAFAFLTELRKLVRWIGVCDGNMEEGSMRCDANISLRLRGETTLGTKVEVKNLNSIRNVKKAIEVETLRIMDLLEKGQDIMQETRSFNADNDTTFSIRTKEDADDYRYFPEPDLTPFILTDTDLEKYRKELPRLPEEWVISLIESYQLTEYDARILAEDQFLLKYYLSITGTCKNYKAVSNWLIGPVKSYCHENGLEIEDITITPGQWKKLIDMIDGGRLNFSVAARRLLPEMMKDSTKDPEEIAIELNIFQVSDTDDIDAWAEEVLKKMPDKVNEFRKGKKGLIGLFVGEVKKISGGKADPKLSTEILLKKLNQS
jgi:aspartyl-tRNA(Asn)/glutamyl-tRNA(Gln) amidotransferase subunit B